MTVKNRLVEFIRLKNIPISQFERMCGMSNGYINSIRKTLGIEKLDNVLNTFPDLNREWLLTGEGPILQKKTLSKIEAAQLHNLKMQESSDNDKLLEKIHELQEEIAALKNERSVLIKTNDRLSKMLENSMNKIFSLIPNTETGS